MLLEILVKASDFVDENGRGRDKSELELRVHFKEGRVDLEVADFLVWVIELELG